MSFSIITGDCVTTMRGMERGSVQLIFADPPYNIGVPYGDHYDDRMTPERYLDLSKRWIEQAVRLLSPTGSMWVLINHEWSARVRIALEDAGLFYRQTITWFESFGQNTTAMFNRCSRPLFWMVKDRERFTFNGDAIRVRSARQEKYGDKRADPRGKLPDDVWAIPRVCGTHKERMQGVPTQLPLALVRRIVACASQPGDLVCDPFAGSGTTAVVCLELMRESIGIELSEHFAGLARKRIANQTMPLALG